MRYFSSLQPSHARRGFTRQNSHRSLGGFTIIEMIVAIAVTTILSGIIISYSSANREQIAVTVETVKIAQTISRARSLAISTEIRTETSSHICGYGITFVLGFIPVLPDSYILSALEEGPSCDVNFMVPRIIERFYLDKNIRFAADAKGIQHSVQRVLFLAPDPTVIVNDETGLKTLPWSLGIETKDALVSSTITIGAGGQVSF